MQHGNSSMRLAWVVILSTLLTLPLQATENSNLKPLLMDGQQTLFQRVLSVPEARLFQSPDADSDNNALTPFSVLYVYERRSGWLNVGHNSFGETVGWMREGQSIVWNQALTVSFKDP